MYLHEIPKEHEPEIKEILARNNSFQFARQDISRLFFFYYKHVARIRKGENAMKKMEKDLTCNRCVSKVLYYFKNTYQ